jgi:hypothetical protein
MRNLGLRAAVTAVVAAEAIALFDIAVETPAEHYSVGAALDGCATERRAFEDLCDENSHNGGNTGLTEILSCGVRDIQDCLVRHGIAESDAYLLGVTCSSYNTTDWTLKGQPSQLPCMQMDRDGDGAPQASTL